MNVLINAVSARLGGGITVLRNLLPAMLAADGGENTYTLAARDDLPAGLGPAHPRVKHLSTGSLQGPRRLLWEQLVLPRRSGGADVLFSPANLAVALAPLPQVLMFQNMAPFDDDVIDRYDPRMRLRLRTLRAMGQATSRGAATVVFISDFARRQTAPQLPLGSKRVTRIYLGRDPAFCPEAKARAPALVQRLGIPGRYLLSVSQFYVYKNLTQLAVGFARACRGLPADVSLVFAGAEIEPDYAAQVRRAVARAGIGHRVRFLGQVPYADLPPLYAGASMFAFPSTCESFPNILIEGMSSGVPTVASCLGPMPELAAEGAAYFDPFDPDDIAGTLLRLWNSPAEAADLAKRGVEVASRYSWDATARELLGELDRAVA